MQETQEVNKLAILLGFEQRNGLFWGRCPYHSEHTPSMSIRDSGLYHCFGCGRSGWIQNDLVNFTPSTTSQAVS